MKVRVIVRDPVMWMLHAAAAAAELLYLHRDALKSTTACWTFRPASVDQRSTPYSAESQALRRRAASCQLVGRMLWSLRSQSSFQEANLENSRITRVGYYYQHHAHGCRWITSAEALRARKA